MSSPRPDPGTRLRNVRPDAWHAAVFGLLLALAVIAAAWCAIVNPTPPEVVPTATSFPVVVVTSGPTMTSTPPVTVPIVLTPTSLPAVTVTPTGLPPLIVIPTEEPAVTATPPPPPQHAPVQVPRR